MVVHGDGHLALGALLADHVLVERFDDLARGAVELVERFLGRGALRLSLGGFGLGFRGGAERFHHLLLQGRARVEAGPILAADIMLLTVDGDNLAFVAVSVILLAANDTIHLHT